MKKLKFFAASLGLMTLAACSNSDEVFNGASELAQNDPNAVSFSTYLGGTSLSRAGWAGAITDTELKDNSKTKGFGVFAYYTQTNSYNSYARTSGDQTSLSPNFMYNERVYWDNVKAADGSYVSNWTYSPVKFWPNEVQNGGVDDQNNDTGSDPATTNYTNGGNLTFFAYAPYVDHTQSLGAEGITAISANNVAGDPKVTYVVPAEGANIVDLLWGTKDNTSLNVNGQGNTGLGHVDGSDYKGDILTGYTLNADLTKQKTNGTVDFAFKHALSKIGGYKAQESTTNRGLMVVLDIDDEKGAETGGTKEDATKVTINSVNIKARTLVSDGSKNPGQDGYTPTYLKQAKGVFNLATGKWNINTDASNKTADQAEAAVTDYNIGVTSGDGQLNDNIAENATDTWAAQPAGVLTTSAQNVYKAGTEAQPLVYIPGTWPELTVTVVYTVRTKDDKLSGGATKVAQQITKKLVFANAVELNKQYSLLMRLGLTSVKFTASVSDWVSVGTVTDGTPVTISETEVANLPINVGVATATLASATQSKTYNVAAGTNAFTINFTGVPNSTAFTTNITTSVATNSITASGTTAADASTKGQAITLNMSTNTGTTDITRVFTFVCDGKTNTITVVQKAGALALSAASTTYAYDQTNIAPTYTVKDFGGNAVTGGTYSVLSTEWATDINSSTGALTNTANNTTRKRSVTVKYTKDNAEGTVVITQGVGTLSVGAISGAPVAHDGGNVTIGVQVNSVNVAAGSHNVKITATQSGGTFADATLTGTISSDGVLTITAPANTGSAATWTITKIQIDDVSKTLESGNTFTQD